MFGGVKLAKNCYPDKYVYSGYGIRFDSLSEFSLSDGSAGKNVIIFRVHVSSSVHIENKVKYILIFGKAPTQGLDDTELIAETKYLINFSRSQKTKKKKIKSLHHNGSNSFDLLMLQKCINSEQKTLK